MNYILYIKKKSISKGEKPHKLQRQKAVNNLFISVLNTFFNYI